MRPLFFYIKTFTFPIESATITIRTAMFFVDRHVKFKTGRSLSKQISASDYSTFTECAWVVEP